MIYIMDNKLKLNTDKIMKDHNSLEVVILLIANGVTLTQKKADILFWVASISRFLCFPHTEATPRAYL